MALECLCGPYPPQDFLTHHGPIEITELPYPYHMNSCHLLMGGSLGAETSLRDWDLQEASPILLTKCLFIFLFQTVYIWKEKGSRFLGVLFLCLCDKNWTDLFIVLNFVLFCSVLNNLTKCSMICKPHSLMPEQMFSPTRVLSLQCRLC